MNGLGLFHEKAYKTETDMTREREREREQRQANQTDKKQCAQTYVLLADCNMDTEMTG